MAAGVNAVGESRRYWAVMPTMTGQAMTGMAKTLEEIGFEGVFSLQIYGPPFVPLAAVAAGTDTLKVSTGIAIAGTRSPLETAMAAMDLDRISDGRFILGLGSSIPSCTEGMYGEPPRKVLGHLRETVDVVRYMIANAHKGLKPYHGTYFKAEFDEMMLTAPPVRETIPIWIAALQTKMTDLALEIGDGLMVHSLWSAQYTAQVQAPIIAAALEKHGRKRDEVEINAWPWVAVNDDRQKALDDARPTVAGYSGYRQYEPFFEALGYGDYARKCQLAADQHGDVSSVVNSIPDEMVRAFVCCGTVDDVLEQIEPFWSVVDSLCPMTPYRNLTTDQLVFYNTGIQRLVAAAKA